MIWLRHTSQKERITLAAAFAGYGLDAFDFMMYSFIIPVLLSQWHMSKADAGYIATGALVTSSVGGWAAGVLADRFGRARVLQLTVLWFAVFTCSSGFARNFGELFAARALQGFGFGGEWAVGSVLVAEIVDARYRGQAAGLVQSSWSVGWAAAAAAFWAVNMLLPAPLAWRVLLWSGILPALLIIYIRRNVAEPPSYLAMRAAQGRAARAESFLDIFRLPLLPTTLWATLLSLGMLGAYYSVTTWLPTLLATERHLSVAGTTEYLLMVIVGSFVGYLVSAWLVDAVGRRAGFISFAICASALILLYTQMPVTGFAMLLIGFPLGFFVLGIFSGMGAFLAELYPAALRGSGQGFCYSIGRGIGGFFPLCIGVLSSHVALGRSIGGFTVAAYALVIVAAWALPETRGRDLRISDSPARTDVL
jgi:MFS family permease